MSPPPPSRRDWRALAGTGLAVLISGALLWQGQHRVAKVVCPLACCFFLLALLLPSCWAPVQARLDRLAKCILALCSWLALGLVFVLVFIPGRLVLLLLQKDPLQRRFSPSQTSYWEPVASKTNHRRQF